METQPCLVSLEHFTSSSSVCSDNNIEESINSIHEATCNINNELPDISNIQICNNTVLNNCNNINLNNIKLLSSTTIKLINQVIINLGKIKIISIQSCNSLRTKYYRTISKLKLLKLLSLIQNDISIIKVDLETLVSESLLETLTFDYSDIFSNISLKNYIEIIRIVDLTFYNLYSILRNIQQCS